MTIELNNISSGYSTGLINDNFQAIEEYVNNNLLNREGIATGESNQMELSLDMNGKFVYNLPEPVLEHQAARLQDVQNAIAGGSANLITFSPYGPITSTNVQGAIEELVDETGNISVTTSTGEQTISAALEQRGPVFDSVASLDASTTLSVGIKVVTLGYYSPGDGGGNQYEIVAAATGTDDGGSFIDLSGSGLQAKGLFPDGVVNVKQFGAVGDGSDDVTPITNAAAFSLDVFFPAGTYGSTTTSFDEDVRFILDEDASLDFITDANVIKSNQFSIHGNIPTIGFLNHGTGSGDNKGHPSRNSLVVLRGERDNPDPDTKYANTAMFVELHTDRAVDQDEAVWGNPFKIPALTVEAEAGPLAEAELVGGSFRASGSSPPVSAADNKKIMVGMSCLGQTNTGAGNAAWSTFGANIITAHTSGNRPINCVGIECDVVHNIGTSTGQTPPGAGDNFTAYWAQSGAKGVRSSAGLYISKIPESLGWNYGIYSSTDFHDWAIYMKNNRNAVESKGIYVETTFGAATGRVLECATAGASQFYVDGSSNDPVWLRVGGTLKKVQQGAVDSGGAGFRVLRVVN